MLQVMRDPFFATFTAFLPLYFLSVDRYIVEKKHGFFIFMVFFMFFNNYYLFYMTSLFTILYYLWRHEKEYGTLHDVMKPAGRLIGFYLVASAVPVSSLCRRSSTFSATAASESGI